jgi:hypothetical protein
MMLQHSCFSCCCGHVRLWCWCMIGHPCDREQQLPRSPQFFGGLNARATAIGGGAFFSASVWSFGAHKRPSGRGATVCRFAGFFFFFF